jgi:hypothetical protein
MRDKSPEPDDADDDMRPEYDFSGWTGVRGNDYQKLRQGYTIQIQQADGTRAYLQTHRILASESARSPVKYKVGVLRFLMRKTRHFADTP